MTRQDRERTKGQSPPETGRLKARRVSQRKELVVVTLGMVAAVSGVSGLLATNPSPSAADTQPVATARQTTAQQAIVQQEAAGQREDAGETAARAGTARKEPEQAARQEENEPRRAETAETNQASGEKAVYSASTSASASAAASGSAVSQGS